MIGLRLFQRSKIRIYTTEVAISRQEHIFQKVCKCYGFAPEFVKKGEKTRFRDFVEIRMLTMYFLRNELKLSWATAGAFCGKDHATAMYAADVVLNLRMSNPEFRKKTESLFIKSL